MDTGVAELFFSGWGFDSRQFEQYEREQDGNVAVLNVGKRVWAVKQFGNHVVFRDVEDNDERAAWFLIKSLTEDEFSASNSFNKQWFIRQWKQGGVGRCVLYIAEYMSQHQCAYLLFRPDGSGVAVDTYETTLMQFTWQEFTLLSWSELLVADPENLQPLCKTIFDTQVNSRIANAYLAPSGMEFTEEEAVPYFFECGSEKELRYLTIAILHSHPILFEQDRKPVTIMYRAKTIKKRGYMAISSWYEDKPFPYLGRLQSLCDLAQRLNMFRGETWFYGLDIPARFNRKVHKIFVEAQPPSAHERAEALLILADWLEGKVSPKKRLRLLGLEDE